MKFTTLLLGFCLIASSNIAHAQSRPNTSEQDKGWSVSLGAGALISPNYMGDNAYALSVVPYIRTTYSDKFFASVQEGIGYNLINTKNFRAGPLASIEFGRDEETGGPFRVSGSDTNDLIGLGDVDTSISLGGFAEYDLGQLTANLKLGQALNGHEGLTGEIGLSYKGVLKGYGPPVIYSIGPRMNYGDEQYMQTFFGVNAEQATASGLTVFEADGGFLSYGISANAIIPMTDNVTLTVFSSLSRLSGDAADSSLVRERGSRDQAFFGLATAYTFD
jgi:outer membrane protein